jgi:predicted naringenin-chalcone synthase
MMGFDLVDSGLKMVLDKEVPETVISLPLFILLKKHDLEINDIDHFDLHPGERNSAETVEALFIRQKH